jgi:hypothetical protein
MQVVLPKYARDLDLFDRFPHALPLAAATGYIKTSTGVSAGNFKLQSEHKERANMPAHRTRDNRSGCRAGTPWIRALLRKKINVKRVNR